MYPWAWSVYTIIPSTYFGLVFLYFECPKLRTTDPFSSFPAENCNMIINSMSYSFSASFPFAPTCDWLTHDRQLSLHTYAVQMPCRYCYANQLRCWLLQMVPLLCHLWTFLTETSNNHSLPKTAISHDMLIHPRAYSWSSTSIHMWSIKANITWHLCFSFPHQYNASIPLAPVILSAFSPFGSKPQCCITPQVGTAFARPSQVPNPHRTPSRHGPRHCSSLLAWV